MGEYYLIAQLPSLDNISDNLPLPITEERFSELCNRFLSKKAVNELNKLTLMPQRTAEYVSSALIKAWNDGERMLRLSLGKARADKLKKQFETENTAIPTELLQLARVAVDMDNPLEAEEFLNRYRLDFLEGLRPSDTFAEDFVFYYGLKLKLISRIKQFDSAVGGAVYRNIYDSIMSNDFKEAIQ